MNVMGMDISTFAVDCVTVPLDGAGSPVWIRFPLTGMDAFDRARSVADSMPGRASVFFDDVLAVGIEEPAGKNPGVIFRVQGAVLSQIPARMLVEKLMPSQWRKLAGLAGNASKDDVMLHSTWAKLYPNAKESPLGLTLRGPGTWPQDAHDAHCIALATRRLIEPAEAA